MKYAAILLALLISACDDTPPPMTNAQIIAAVKQCESAGMKAEQLSTLDDPRIRVVQCKTKDGDAK